MDYLLALTLITLHSIDGFVILINPAHVVMLRPSSEAAKGTPNTLIGPGLRCSIGLADGKFVSVVETCDTVRAMIETGK